MTKEEFQEYYKKNKMVVIGIPFIVGFLLINQFVLKPMFLKDRAAAAGTPAAGVVTPEAAATPGIEGTAGSAVLAPPPPLTINLSTIPLLNKRVESRFTVNPSYPYDGSRSVFGGPQKPPPTPEPVAEYQPETIATPTARPEITYHGFYNIGPDRIAIIRLGERLVLSRAGQQLADSAFVLDVILPDKILVRDTEHQDSPFAVDLAEAQGLGKVDAKGMPTISAKPGK